MSSLKASEDLATGDLAPYWFESKRPLVCLAFVAPILLVYEVGVLVLGAQATRNGVDVYLRGALEMLGFGQYFLLPLLTASILLAWHHTTSQPWRLRSNVLVGMAFESLALGFSLLFLARMQVWMFSASPAAITCASAASTNNGGFAGQLIGYFGAGIYEELLFRLILLWPVAGLIKYIGAPRWGSLVGAIIITSLVFSAAHYKAFTFNGGAEDLEMFSFLFRFIAGVFFSTLFLYRGFGIAVGAHALYDILVVVSVV